MERLSLDARTVNMLLEEFFESLPADLEALRKAIESKDVKEVYAKAHYIKGACGNLAMDEPFAILAKMESMAKNGEVEGYDMDGLVGSFEKIERGVMR